MGTIVASTLLARASILLQDTTNVRWPQAELLGWLNDGLREIAAARPDQSSKYAAITLVAGTRQSLPSDAVELMRITRNMGTDGATPGRAIRKVPHDLLDSQTPDWHSSAPASTIKHYTYDPRAPHAYYVFPPSDGTTKVEALYVAAPTVLTDATQTITIDDMFANILLDYVAFRAYSKDLEEAGNPDRAELHRKLFTDSLQSKSTADGGALPQDQVKG